MPNITNVVKPAFQFHKGTIKTLYTIFGGVVYTLFQFHKGTIKTLGSILRSSLARISIP